MQRIGDKRMIDLKEWFFKRFKSASPKGEIEVPVKYPDFNAESAYRMVGIHFAEISSSISRMEEVNSLLNSPRVKYVKDMHTKATSKVFDGLGSISIVYDTESGKALCAEIIKEVKE